MIHFFILFLWNVFCLSSKPKTNAVEKQKQEHNNDNNQSLVRELMRLKFMRLKLSHVCAGLDQVFLLMCKEISFQHGRAKT